MRLCAGNGKSSIKVIWRCGHTDLVSTTIVHYILAIGIAYER